MFKFKTQWLKFRTMLVLRLLEMLPKAPSKPYSREWLREEGAKLDPMYDKMCFVQAILPRKILEAKDLDRVDYTDAPLKFVDAPALALSGSAAVDGIGAKYVRSRRLPCFIQRVLGPRVIKDELEFMSSPGFFQSSAKRVMQGFALHIDSKFIAAIAAISERPRDADCASEYQVICAQREGIPDDTAGGLLQELMLGGPAHYQLRTVLLNNWTAIKVLGELPPAAKHALEKYGMTAGLDTETGVRWVVTAHDRLVKNGTLFGFCAAEDLGAHFSTQAPTLSTANEDYIVKFFAWCTAGIVLTAPGGVVRLDYPDCIPVKLPTAEEVAVAVAAGDRVEAEATEAITNERARETAAAMVDKSVPSAESGETKANELKA